jgi:mannosyl-3-phosphoglycerate phosphatase family protein
MSTKVVIFTDLDGTLLDDNYSFEDAIQGLKLLREYNIPLIYCSAKTKAEQEVIREKMDINDPFIVENGSAIYIPRGHFKNIRAENADGYEVVILGIESAKIIEEIRRLRERFRIKNYYFMSDEEVAEVTGLSLEDARRAKMREFGETIVEAEEDALNELRKKFEVVHGGRFIQVYGIGADKGEAVRILTEMYRKEFGDVKTVGIGNALNDLPMLKAVQYPAVVKNSDGTWAEIEIENLYREEKIGPSGWAEVVKKFVKKFVTG